MRVLLLANYYWPETVGAAIWIHQLARDLKAQGHEATVVTSMPSYPAGEVFPAYRGRRFMRERRDDIDIIRTFTYATKKKSFWARVANFGAFCLSAALQPMFMGIRADVVYAIQPPLPLGAVGWLLAKRTGAKLVVNVQDIYPDIAVVTGFLTNRHAIRFFAAMERWIYRRAERVVVISQGFLENLAAKGVPKDKIAIVPNWADPNEIRPCDKDNAFRQSLALKPDEFVVLYAGGLSMNSALEPVIDAARLMQGEPFRFVLAGDGPQKPQLEARAAGLANVRFLPFQPLEKYAETLSAADATLVTLNSAATFCSVPSKIFKQMAVARPVVAITSRENELTRLIDASGGGMNVIGGDSADLARTLRWARENQAEFAAMGVAGRAYLEQECSRAQCVGQIARVFEEVAVPPKRADWAKRAFDLLLASLALIGLAPLMLACAVAVRMGSEGPVFFRQRRLGLNGVPFEVLKFRTMRANAPDVRNADGSTYSGDSDPRVTREGRWLRAASMDELPQLWNVLRGEMSVVGPRPDVIGATERYRMRDFNRLKVKPGLTGWAQVHGRNGITWQRRRDLDVDYVARRSFALDLRILRATVPLVLLGRGVHQRSRGLST